VSAAAREPTSLAAQGGPETIPQAVAVFYRHWSPRFLTGWLAVTAGIRLALGPPGLGDAIVAGLVVALWPLQEWLIHVFILHWKPRRILGRTLDFEVPRAHRAHHRDPWRLDLVFIPTHVFYATPLLIVGLFWLLAPSRALAFTGLSVYFLLALHYEWVHFLVHTRYVPKHAWYRRLFRNHRLHHFKNEYYWYGVTMLGGDHLLRTAPDPARVPRSPTARTVVAAAPADE
jgi:hypothetical protein